MKNILLSYPRSGNHLVRFFIELLTEKPTFGCMENRKDVEIYKNKFSEYIPFNIKEYNINDCFFKLHVPPRNNGEFNEKLIFIIRNPREVLLRNNNYKLFFNSYDVYFKNIDYYDNFKGKKILLYYEDMITNKVDFINIMCDFLSVQNDDKKKYVIENIEKLFFISHNGENRSWGGNVSNSELNFYYNKISETIKNEFDNYIDKKMQKYNFLKTKYNN